MGVIGHTGTMALSLGGDESNIDPALEFFRRLEEQGQLNFVKGHARPVRDIWIPEELKEKLIPDEQYTNRLPDQRSGCVEIIGMLRQEEVMAYAK